MKDFIKKRDKWLQEVAEQCHQYALEVDLDFYVAQTPLNYQAPLLIIGLNPGGEVSYQKILKQKSEDLGEPYLKRRPQDLYYEDNTIAQKPDWETGRGADRLRQNFTRLFNKEHQLDILEESIMINMFYFNTNNIERADKQLNQEIKAYCLKKTLELIEILNPKNTLFLTSNEGRLTACSVEQIKSLGHYLKTGFIGERKVYALPHYSYYRAWSYKNCALVGKKLSELFIK